MSKFRDISGMVGPLAGYANGGAGGMPAVSSDGYANGGMGGMPVVSSSGYPTGGPSYTARAPAELLGGHAAGAGLRSRAMDLSRLRFSPSMPLRPVAELLQALPMVKGDPVMSNISGGSSEETNLLVQIQYFKDEEPLYDPMMIPVYGSTGSPAPKAVSTLTNSIITFSLARLGFYIKGARIDSEAASWEASGNPTSNRVSTAVNQLLTWIDYSLGHTTSMPASFDSLGALATKLGRISNIPAGSPTLEQSAQRLLSEINPRGRGAGAGPHCLIGNARMMRSLMATESGTTGASGWFPDRRTGLLIYHYQGVPFYRADLEDTNGDKTEGYLFAANLGPDGLHLVHAYGTAESYGVQIDEEPIVPSTAQVHYVVHGAWELVAFDSGAIKGYDDVTYTVA